MAAFATNLLDGTRIAYEVRGAGRPIALLHGFTCNRSWWERAGYVEALQGAFRLILIDSRGHGDRDKPRSSAANHHRLTTADVLAVFDELGEEIVDVVG